MSSDDRGALQERMKRRDAASAGLWWARASRSWCIVGTPEYQVTRCSRTVRQKESALKLVGTTTVPPESRVAMVEPIKPWMWNSGMIHSETSSSESAYVLAILADETA